MTFLALLPSCNGIFQGIYDSGEGDLVTEYGFLEYNPSEKTGTIYIDATDYTKWIYLDFSERTAVTAGMSEEEAPAEWDIAVHRYDVKTNGAAALETGMTGLELFMSSGAMPEGDYVGDEWTTEQIIVDMSGMMDGNIGYSESWYNRELSKWLKVDTGTMPPVYSMSHLHGRYGSQGLHDHRLCISGGILTIWENFCYAPASHAWLPCPCRRRQESAEACSTGTARLFRVRRSRWRECPEPEPPRTWTAATVLKSV